MKWWYNNKTEEHNIVLHQHIAAFNIGTINSATWNSATLKNSILNGKTLNQCNIKLCNIEKVQHLTVKYHNGTISNSVAITIAIKTCATATRAIWKIRTLK